ncbi:hypothetical protein A2368_00235 [Candidatus Collierbacteria bacterium RIFOXYB1_FULL_49_13]|uniref:Uncharacterized protein n=1 Tax=Candidatus Collierbacteria bacterium RIFOXYB1_FULL_49_13 TaxID=1817728 RepID=A0A1F5FF85_9BACT|nr:MAG: hypothetical protein A2368_00235 [Candidatus Collierbacteria bacterium RIFOXYB1_FULL_49_13]
MRKEQGTNKQPRQRVDFEMIDGENFDWTKASDHDIRRMISQFPRQIRQAIMDLVKKEKKEE